MASGTETVNDAISDKLENVARFVVTPVGMVVRTMV